MARKTYRNKSGKRTYSKEDAKKKNSEALELIETQLAKFIGEDAKEKPDWESYIHSTEVNVPARKLVMEGGEHQVEQFNVIQFAQVEVDMHEGKIEVNVPVFATFKHLNELLTSCKDEFRLDNAPQGFDPDKPMKGKIAKAAVISSFATAWDTEEKKSLTGKDLYKRIDELQKRGLSRDEMHEILTNFQTKTRQWQYFAIEDFKDILPEKIIDSIPEFAAYEKLKSNKMSPERVNLEARIDAEIVKIAMTSEYDQISFVEKDLNTAHCITAEDRSYSTVYMAERRKYMSDIHYCSTMLHEFVHATQSIDKRKLDSKRVDGLAVKEEILTELSATMIMKKLGYDNINKHAGLLKYLSNDDIEPLRKMAQKADKVYPIVFKAYEKYNTPELRKELRERFEAEDKQRLEVVKEKQPEAVLEEAEKPTRRRNRRP
ncbi:zincin-like metallopeptidase domain-containing protein [Vibrio atypicus]|uniref:zincin-like metallopeptidase domain-containing protein n=1 Tax=Vibrio atypicus TaxID=558271 RepID=UPI00135A02ED|nr:zincin-like metallopeptidase domain-containing protein [Vibrio atypicus]